MPKRKREKKIKIRVKKPYIAYPGSVVQQNYAEDLTHGYLLWNIEDRNAFDVRFCSLPNPKPFVTIPWQGSVETTVEHARAQHAVGGRFRVYSTEALSQKEIIEIQHDLRNKLQAAEVTFKTDHQFNRDLIITGANTVIKEDLRSSDVLVRLLKEYHHAASVDDNVWSQSNDLVKGYLAALGTSEVIRNTSWSLRHLKFDNTFAYGEGNSINFENMGGIVGIFGPNRSGKSSIVGTIMYALFNSTDRGSIKNLHIINARKPYCYTRAVISVDSVDYVIERQTVKNENKHGHIHASTALNVFRVDDGEAVDIAGEQRNDTERVIRRLIGSEDDFLMTSLSAQDEIKLFITHGSVRRRQVLARFLDLDIFDRMYDAAKTDLNVTKALLRALPNRDWMALDVQCYERLEACEEGIEKKDAELQEINARLDSLRRSLAVHHDFTPVTKTQVDSQRARVTVLTDQVNDVQTDVDAQHTAITRLCEKVDKIVALQSEYDYTDIKRRYEAFRTLESTFVTLKHVHEKELTTLKHHERSLKILDDVPCGDKFPTCKFIKDAHAVKGKVDPQRVRSEQALEKLQKAEHALTTLRQENLASKLDKIEQLTTMLTTLNTDVSAKRLVLVKLESSLESLMLNLETARARLDELEVALENEENEEVVALRFEIDALQASIKCIDDEKLAFASERGRVMTIIEKHVNENQQRTEILNKMRAYELITQAFSRRGIPSAIISSQLPAINAEIAKILHGIVDFTIELEADDESDSMEVYINYGDSRRIIDLGSGMEKMIASVAIRVALINVSSLPKTDMFVIDEGFGALDEAGVEACNRLLSSLKRYFKTIIVITHVEGVKDAADLIIEVTKNENDAHVVYL